ncbi:MAG: hypothetical protein ACRC6E_06350 [Fusobacteriaceae bacterium]
MKKFIHLNYLHIMEFIKKFGRDPNKQKKKIYLDENFFLDITKIETTGYTYYNPKFYKIK